jgi:Rrf2 family iron-sulfur cluster assembly transcriptional regulator
MDIFIQNGTFRPGVTFARRCARLESVIFSASTTHALRALAWLAAHDGGEAVLGRDLARKLKLPPDYLSKVLGTLARNGVLTASRGVKGGYRLARPASRIRLIEVVEPFEGKRARPGCLLRPERPCRDSGACTAHSAWGGMKRTYQEFLEKTTLADIHQDGARPPAR